MRKSLLVISVTVLLGSAVLLVTLGNQADRLAALYTRKVMLLMQQKKDWPGFVITGLRCNGVTVSWNQLEWRDITAELELNTTNRMLEDKRLHISIEHAVIRPQAIGRQLFRLQATGMRVVARGRGQQTAAGGQTRLEQGTFGLTFRLALPDREKSVALVREVVQDLCQLRQRGYTRVPISFTGQGSLSVRGTVLPATFSVQHHGDRYFLSLDRQSIRLLSRILDEELTEPEVALLARVPFLTPELLEIRDEARRVAKRLHRQEGISEDAYRHVLWSYLLTRRFGPELAEEVTDAHEQGLTDNTEADHRMDYQNNTVGRNYALNNVSRQQLLERFRTDPAIIRSPGEAP